MNKSRLITPPRSRNSKKSKQKSPSIISDRFIPSRSASFSSPLLYSASKIIKEDKEENGALNSFPGPLGDGSNEDSNYSQFISSSFPDDLPTPPQSSKSSSKSSSTIFSSPNRLKFSSKARNGSSELDSFSPSIYPSPQRSSSSNPSPQKNLKVEPKSIRILDAPNIIDDFYFSILDWSSQNEVFINRFCVACSNFCLFLM